MWVLLSCNIFKEFILNIPNGKRNYIVKTFKMENLVMSKNLFKRILKLLKTIIANNTKIILLKKLVKLLMKEV